MSRNFEPERLSSIFDGDLESVREILTEAVASGRALVERFACSGTQSQRDTRLKLLHELKGLSGNVGAERLEEVSAQLYGRLLHSNDEVGAVAIQEVVECFRRFADEAQQYLTRLATP